MDETGFQIGMASTVNQRLEKVMPNQFSLEIVNGLFLSLQLMQLDLFSDQRLSLLGEHQSQWYTGVPKG